MARRSYRPRSQWRRKAPAAEQVYAVRRPLREGAGRMLIGLLAIPIVGAVLLAGSIALPWYFCVPLILPFGLLATALLRRARVPGLRRIRVNDTEMIFEYDDSMAKRVIALAEIEGVTVDIRPGDTGRLRIETGSEQVEFDADEVGGLRALSLHLEDVLRKTHRGRLAGAPRVVRNETPAPPMPGAPRVRRTENEAAAEPVEENEDDRWRSV